MGFFQARILAASETVGKLTFPTLCLGFSLSIEEVVATAELLEAAAISEHLPGARLCSGRNQMTWSPLSQTSAHWTAALPEGRTMRQVFRKGKWGLPRGL